MVDRLLARPQFGERWGRHWLDVARYAESSGKDANIAFPNAWRFRDYTIAAFNADKPFDEFVREQLAGDLLPAANPAERAEHLVATGFLALGPKSLNEQNRRQYALDLADEQIDATSQAFLGLTVACARCHDHKFDPIPQKEYYSLAGIFLSTDTRYGTGGTPQDRHPTELLELPSEAHAATLARTLSEPERAQKQSRVAALQEQLKGAVMERMAQRAKAGPDATGTPAPADPKERLRNAAALAQIGSLQAELKSFNEDGTAKAQAMGACDLPAGAAAEASAPAMGRNRLAARMRQRLGRGPEFKAIGDCAVYARGDADKPGEKVARGFLTLLTTSTPPSIPAETSGRLQLAEWITSPANPLTARVIVNRVWHWIFGEGLVPTPDNFGTSGASPTDQALLDALAVRFQKEGWSVKKLVREIVLSRTYGLASTYQEAAFAADPENTLLWRASKRRLDAESIRDAMLWASGQLELKPPVGSIIAEAGDGPIAGRRKAGASEGAIVDSGASLKVRSAYLPVVRDLLPDALAVFDFSEPSLVSGSRESTNVPSQALYLLNSPFATHAAQGLAGRLLAAYPGGPNGGLGANFEQRLTLAYWMTCSRPPTPAERQAAATFFSKFPGAWKPGDARVSTLHDEAAILAAWTSLCRALFASSDFRYLN